MDAAAADDVSPATEPEPSREPEPEVTAAALIAGHVHRHGPARFDAVMDLALYHPEAGYFTRAVEAGRRGDFITSPEVGPLFGAVLARALDTWWHELGRPDPFVVVEAGAGRGALAIAVHRARPACLAALTYVLVESSPRLRSRHGEHLPLEHPSHALLPAAPDPDGLDVVAGRGSGPRFVSLPDLPALPVSGVVIANELLDNLPTRVVRREEEGWAELHATLAGTGPALTECWVACTDDEAAALDRTLPPVPVGVPVPLHQEARRWIRRALDLLTAGRLVVVDYGEPTTAELVDRRPDRSWLRTFHGHDRGRPPLEALGQQDVTVDVAFDQLAPPAVPAPARLRSQADFLRAHGIDELVEEGRAVWSERGHLGDLVAIEGRSRVREAEALCDPTGLGGFLVAEWTVP